MSWIECLMSYPMSKVQCLMSKNQLMNSVHMSGHWALLVVQKLNTELWTLFGFLNRDFRYDVKCLLMFWPCSSRAAQQSPLSPCIGGTPAFSRAAQKVWQRFMMICQCLVHKAFQQNPPGRIAQGYPSKFAVVPLSRVAHVNAFICKRTDEWIYCFCSFPAASGPLRGDAAETKLFLLFLRVPFWRKPQILLGNGWFQFFAFFWNHSNCCIY